VRCLEGVVTASLLPPQDITVGPLAELAIATGYVSDVVKAVNVAEVDVLSKLEEFNDSAVRPSAADGSGEATCFPDLSDFYAAGGDDGEVYLQRDCSDHVTTSSVSRGAVSEVGGPSASAERVEDALCATASAVDVLQESLSVLQLGPRTRRRANGPPLPLTPSLPIAMRRAPARSRPPPTLQYPTCLPSGGPQLTATAAVQEPTAAAQALSKARKAAKSRAKDKGTSGAVEATGKVATGVSHLAAITLGAYSNWCGW
jgi:hypothetical protein